MKVVTTLSLNSVKDVSKWSGTASPVTVRATASFLLVIPAPVQSMQARVVSRDT